MANLAGAWRYLAVEPEERSVRFESIVLDDFELSYVDPSREEPLRLAVALPAFMPRGM